MLFVLSLLLTIYLSILIYFYLAQRSLIFYPQPGAFVYQDHAFEVQIGGHWLRGWVLNQGQEAAVIYFGGNNENIQQNINRFARWFPQYTVYLINYRGYGESEGSPSEAVLFSDALEHYDLVAAQHGSVCVIGRSLGSGVACHVAAHRAVERLILITPYDSINNIGRKKYWYIPVNRLLKDKFESWRLVPSINAETLIIIAVGDDVIPNERSEHLVGFFEKTVPKVVELTDTTHAMVMNHPHFARFVRDFFER